MCFLIIYTIGVLISGIIAGIVLYNTDDDITKKRCVYFGPYFRYVIFGIVFNGYCRV